LIQDKSQLNGRLVSLYDIFANRDVIAQATGGRYVTLNGQRPHYDVDAHQAILVPGRGEHGRTDGLTIGNSVPCRAWSTVRTALRCAQYVDQALIRALRNQPPRMEQILPGLS
jgi:hypothetical protein